MTTTVDPRVPNWLFTNFKETEHTPTAEKWANRFLYFPSMATGTFGPYKIEKLPEDQPAHPLKQVAKLVARLFAAVISLLTFPTVLWAIHQRNKSTHQERLYRGFVRVNTHLPKKQTLEELKQLPFSKIPPGRVSDLMDDIGVKELFKMIKKDLFEENGEMNKIIHNLTAIYNRDEMKKEATKLLLLSKLDENNLGRMRLLLNFFGSNTDKKLTLERIFESLKGEKYVTARVAVAARELSHHPESMKFCLDKLELSERRWVTKMLAEEVNSEKAANLFSEAAKVTSGILSKPTDEAKDFIYWLFVYLVEKNEDCFQLAFSSYLKYQKYFDETPKRILKCIDTQDKLRAVLDVAPLALWFGRYAIAVTGEQATPAKTCNKLGISDLAALAVLNEDKYRSLKSDVLRHTERLRNLDSGPEDS